MTLFLFVASTSTSTSTSTHEAICDFGVYSLGDTDGMGHVLDSSLTCMRSNQSHSSHILRATFLCEPLALHESWTPRLYLDCSRPTCPPGIGSNDLGRTYGSDGLHPFSTQHPMPGPEFAVTKQLQMPVPQKRQEGHYS